MSESEEEQSDLDEAGEKVADKITRPRDVNVVMNSFAANEVHHFPKSVSSCFSYSAFDYGLNDSQYVIANSDQVKVKYIVQIQKVPSK